MVWFQCEDCGENLKKPKLQGHFRSCSAGKLSCIDCGVIFNQQSVQNHTQCISEAEKYGPKAVGGIKEALKTKHKEQNLDGSVLDTSIGLSTRAPWSCSLCNVKATSQETLLLHSQGKKHRLKARAVSTKLPTKSGSEFVCNSAAATMQPLSPVLPDNSFVLVESNVTGIRSNVLEEKALSNPDMEIEQLHKDNSAMLEDQRGHQEASGLNKIYFSHLCDTDGNSGGQETEKMRKKRKVSNGCLKSNDSEKSDKKCKKDEDVRRRIDCTSAIKQEKTQRIHMGLSSNKGSSFEQTPEIALDRSTKQAENVEKSTRKKKDRPVDSSEHERSDVSWEDLKDVSDGLANLKRRNEGAECTNCLAYKQRQDSAHETWSNLVKWKKLIRRAFKNTSNGSLTIKLLRKSVLPHAMKTLETSGVSPDEKSLQLVLDSKIHSYRNLIIDGKKVKLAKNDNAK